MDDKIYHIDLPSKEQKEEILKKEIETSNIQTPKIQPQKESKKFLIGLIVSLAILLLLFNLSLLAFYNKDFSEFIKINNEVPDIPIAINDTNSYNNTFVNNVTVRIVLDGEIAEMIANQTIFEVKKQLNST